MKKRLMSLVLAAALLLGLSVQASGAGIHYLPDVTAEMSAPGYWTKEDRVLMTWEEIAALNALTISTGGTNMYDLKNQAETVDGIACNELLLSSTQADIDYYLGWTYLGDDVLATQEDFDPILKNTQNPNAKVRQTVRYGVAVHRTELLAFPTDIPIWDDPRDPDFDYRYLVGVRVNEPLVITSVSADGNYYLAKSICASGWVPAEDVAICKDKAEWLAAWDLAPEDTLVVYGDKVYTETSLYSPETSRLLLTMGTALELSPVEDPNVLIDNRAPYQNYVVWVPIRQEDGSYRKKQTLISEHAKVREGYLPLTEANIAKVALGALGNTYGWGGSLQAEDCSAYIRNIYKCFGLELARNTTWQAAMPMAKVDLRDMCQEERLEVLQALPLGTVLYFSGHEMLYLGRDNRKDYVLSAVSKIRIPDSAATTQRIRGIVLNTLDIQRASGITWLDALTTANVPCWGLLEGKDYDLPAPAWYHDGVAFCMKHKIMQPMEDGFFHLEDAVTRAQVAQILWNMEGNPEAGAPAPFDDVAEEAWYAPAVSWAAEVELILGITEDTFAPEDTVTREQLAAILYRYARSKGQGFEGAWAFPLDYSDADQVSDYAYEPLCWLTMKGIFTGVEDGRLAPKDALTRAQLAVIIQRFGL